MTLGINVAELFSFSKRKRYLITKGISEEFYENLEEFEEKEKEGK